MNLDNNESMERTEDDVEHSECDEEEGVDVLENYKRHISMCWRAKWSRTLFVKCAACVYNYNGLDITP